MKIVLRAKPLAMICAVCALLSTPVLSAQAQDESAAAALVGIGSANALSELQARVQEAAMQGSSLALEGAVDPNEYTVGPGDRFNATIGGLISNTFSLVVSAGGYLDLPEAGQIRAADRSLAAVQEEASALLQEAHAHVPVSISLVQTRSFYVHISGAVPQPGRYLMMPISRVDELLAEAYAPKYYDVDSGEYIYLPARRPELDTKYRPAFRNITIDHRDGTVTRIDMVRYYIFGETAHNPYLRDGDRIVVPSYHEIRDGVRVSGDIAYAGSYDLRLGDTAADLIALAAGPNGTASIDSVVLARSHSRIPLRLDVQRMLRGEADNPALEAGDHLVAKTMVAAIGRIQGRVWYPGSYSITEGRTTIRDLVDMAGGLKPDANIDAAFLERSNSLDFRESSSQSNLDYFSRDFFRSFEQELSYRVTVDVASELQSDHASVVLYDGDRLVFPRDEKTVQVSGQVAEPAYVPYQEGQPASYYLNRTGGITSGGTRVLVFRSATGKIQEGASVVVRSGDTIFVDRKPIADSPDAQALLLTARQVRSQRISNIISGISVITGILTSYVLISERN